MPSTSTWSAAKRISTAQRCGMPPSRRPRNSTTRPALGLLPRRIVNVTIGTSNSQVSTVTIPKLFYFSARQAGATRLFSTNEAVVARNEGGTINVKNLELFEGRIITEKFVAGSQRPNIILSSPNIDINSINVLGVQFHNRHHRTCIQLVPKTCLD
jgi:hypothetical protein